MSSSYEPFPPRSLTVGTWHRWRWDLEVEFSNVEWRSLPCPNGNITVSVFTFTSSSSHTHVYTQYLHLWLFQIPSTQSATWCSPQRTIWATAWVPPSHIWLCHADVYWLSITINLTVQNSTVTARAKNFHSVQYLLVHGTADGELCRAAVYLFTI